MTKSHWIETELRENIDTGIWRIGEKLPSESELMQHFQASRSLIRNVLTKLNQEGLIESIQGKGSFIKNPKIHVHTPHQRKISEQLVRRGYIEKTETLDFYESFVTRKIARFLSIQQDPRVYVLRQRHYVQGVPFCVSEIYLPKSLYPQLEGLRKEDAALHVTKNDCALSTNSSREFLELIFSFPETAALLETSPGYPLLRLEQVNYTSENVPHEYISFLFRGDRIRLHFDYNRAESEPEIQALLPANTEAST